jgi:dihydropyrimidinase
MQKGYDSRPFTEIPAGVSNIQTGVGMLYSKGVSDGRISLERFVEVVSSNPAKIFGMWPKKGAIAIGSDADLALIDPLKRMRIDLAGQVSNADFDVYEGQSFRGWPVMTLSRGEILCRDGEVTSSPGRGEFVHRSITQQATTH